MFDSPALLTLSTQLLPFLLSQAQAFEPAVPPPPPSDELVEGIMVRWCDSGVGGCAAVAVAKCCLRAPCIQRWLMVRRVLDRRWGSRVRT